MEVEFVKDGPRNRISPLFFANNFALQVEALSLTRQMNEIIDHFGAVL